MVLTSKIEFFLQKKQELMRKLLMPIVTKFDEVLQCLLTESDPARQMSYATCLTQAMGFARLGLVNLLCMRDYVFTIERIMDSVCTETYYNF